MTWYRKTGLVDRQRIKTVRNSCIGEEKYQQRKE